MLLIASSLQIITLLVTRIIKPENNLLEIGFSCIFYSARAILNYFIFILSFVAIYCDSTIIIYHSSTTFIVIVICQNVFSCVNLLNSRHTQNGSAVFII